MPWLRRSGGAILATASLAPAADLFYAAVEQAVIGLVRFLARARGGLGMGDQGGRA